MIDMDRHARIFVAGHRGLVGSAILRRLSDSGYVNLVTATRQQLDLRDQAAVNYWFRANRPDYVFLVAGTVGGILANSTRPAEFLYDNMLCVHIGPQMIDTPIHHYGGPLFFALSLVPLFVLIRWLSRQEEP